MNTAVTVALLVVFCTWLYRLVIHKDPRIKALPKLKGIPFFGNVLSLDPHNYNETVYDFFEKTKEKIMVVFVFNKPLVFMADPLEAYEIMHDEETFLRQGNTFIIFTRTMGNVLFAIDGSEWKARRTRLNHSFGPPKLKNLFPTVAEKSEQMVEVIEKAMKSDGFVEVDTLFVKLTADIIFPFIMSKDYRVMFDDPHQLDSYFGALRDEGFKLGAFPFWKYLPMPSRFRFAQIRKKFNTLLDETINERMNFRNQNPEAEAADMLDLLIDKGGSIEDIRVELVGLVFAGHDTTAHTMAFGMYELTKPENKTILEKLRKEVDSLVPSTNGIDRIAQLDDVNRLEYLSAFIKEVLRLYPIAIAHPVQAQKDVTVAGYDLPKGTEVLIHYFSFHRLSKYWKDPLVFRPERWIEISSPEFERNNELSRCKLYMPFLSGPHVCLGQHVAQLEMKMIISTLLKNFNFELRPNSKVIVGTMITLLPINGVQVVFTPRKKLLQ